MNAESFLITYTYKSKGQVIEKDMRMDDSQGETAMRERFGRMYPRRTIVKVRDISTGVKAGFSYY